MRKLIAALLAACLMLTAPAALMEEAPEDAAEETDLAEDPARVAVNLQAIKVMLDANGLVFEYQEETDSFFLTSTLDGPIEDCLIWLTAYEDGVWFRADYGVDVPEDQWEELLKFCSLCNETIRIGSFYLDREYGSVGYKFFILSDVLPPTQYALSFVAGLAVGMLEYRAPGVQAILDGNADAQAAMDL